MTNSINKAQIMGYVGQDPEIKQMTNGKKLASFSIATSKKYKNKEGEEATSTQWHKIVVFGDGLVQLIAERVKKGTQLYVEGEIQTRMWEDKMKNKKYVTEIIVQGFSGMVHFLGDKPAPAKVLNANVEESEEIPF